MSEPIQVPVSEIVVTPIVRLVVELHDAFGTIVGRGEIVMDSQKYPDPELTADELSLHHVANAVGRYVHGSPPNPRLAWWMRVRRSE